MNDGTITARREDARHSSGRFGVQDHSAPEMALTAGPDLSSWEPKDVDGKLNELLLDEAKAIAPYVWTERELQRDEAVLAGVERDGERYEGQADYYRGRIAEHTAKLREIQDQVRAIRREQGFYEAEYDYRGGWTRAYLVPGPQGHVHSGMSCSTCNREGKLTRFAWLTEYSGMDEDALVEAAGQRACTTCFPSAPVEVLSRPTTMFSADEKRQQAEREERAQAKLARDAKRIENGLTADGSEFTVRTDSGEGPATWRNTESFKTERAAVMWATDKLGWRGYGAPSAERVEREQHEDRAIDEIAQAVARKHNLPVDYVRGDIAIKGQRKAEKITAGEAKKALAALAAEHGVTR